MRTNRQRQLFHTMNEFLNVLGQLDPRLKKSEGDVQITSMYRAIDSHIGEVSRKFSLMLKRMIDNTGRKTVFEQYAQWWAKIRYREKNGSMVKKRIWESSKTK